MPQGTQIRTGPGLSFKSTIPAQWGSAVPVQGWAVKIIGGPECADGWEWWNTDRGAVDGSGGTGWAAIGPAQCAGSPTLNTAQQDFNLLRTNIPTAVGNYVGQAQVNLANGDVYQTTTHGLLVDRKADGLTAFTDGFRTWINTALGVFQRLNTCVFPWESNSNGQSRCDASTSSPPSPQAGNVSPQLTTLLNDIKSSKILAHDSTGSLANVQIKQGLAQVLGNEVFVGNFDPRFTDDAQEACYKSAIGAIGMQAEKDWSTVAIDTLVAGMLTAPIRQVETGSALADALLKIGSGMITSMAGGNPPGAVIEDTSAKTLAAIVGHGLENIAPHWLTEGATDASVKAIVNQLLRNEGVQVQQIENGPQNGDGTKVHANARIYYNPHTDYVTATITADCTKSTYMVMYRTSGDGYGNGNAFEANPAVRSVWVEQ